MINRSISTKDKSPLKKAPLFICGCPKSGTTLLRALLDGHPELLIFPMEMKFFRYTDYPTLFPEKKLCRESKVKTIADNMLAEKYFRIFLRKEKLSFAGNEEPPDYSSVDPEIFENYFTDLSKVDSLHSLFIHCFKALLSGMDKPIDNLSQYHLVDKTPFLEEYASILKKWFSNARFIHVVRNPYANFVALRKRETLLGSSPSYPYLYDIIKWMKFSAYLGEYNKRLMGDESYMMVRYEDLIKTTEPTMRRICAFADIAFDEILLQPTQEKNLWQGNSMSQQKFIGIDSAPLEHWKSDITDFELALLNQKLDTLFDRFNYPKKQPKYKLNVYSHQARESN